MKRIASFFVAFCLVVVSFAGVQFTRPTKEVKAASSFGSNDFLKVNGTKIRNRSGQGSEIYLRGTNAGGLFVKENWQNSTESADQKTELETLINRFGESKAYELLEYYKDNFWTESDFDKCAEMGMSVIRLPFTYMNIYKKSGNDWVVRSDAFTRMDWFVEQCSKRGIYVILDLHGAFGSQNGQDHSGQVIDNVNDVTFFYNDTLKNQTLDLWKLVAGHYRGNPAVAGYDTLNEPGEKAGTTTTRHWEFYNQMYNAIRSVDPDHIVIMESCWGTGNLPNPSTYGWTNVVYEYHNYPWGNETDEKLDALKSSVDSFVNSVNNANYGVPTFVGEFTCFEAWNAWAYWPEKFNQAGYHYTSWTYKTHYMGSWGIFNQKGTAKANVASDSEDTIRSRWGAGNIGTGDKSKSGNVYNALKAAMPGTVTPLGGDTSTPAVGRHEAEDAIGFVKENGTDEHKIESSDSFSGGKAVGGMNCWPNDGRAYCTTKVNADTAGKYTMTIGYAGGEANHPCNIDVRVNNDNWVSTLAPVTAGWNTVGTISLTIDLKQGENTIDVTGACNIWYDGMNWEWINLDYFDLALQSAPTTQAPITQAPTTTKNNVVDGTEILKNTTFNGADNWNEYTNGSSTFTNKGNGSVEVNVQEYNGGDNWATQLVQSPLSLDKNKYYVATYTVKSNVAKKFQLLMQTTDYSVLDVNQTVAVNAGETKLIKAVFKPSSDNTYLYGAMMGFVDNTASAAANVVISNVSLKVYNTLDAANDAASNLKEPETQAPTTTQVQTTTQKPTETQAPTTVAPTTQNPSEIRVSNDIVID